MKILVTNDDGISSPVLPLLAKWAATLGEVTVVAPAVEQSGRSQAIEIYHGVKIRRVELVEGIPCYAMDSTPADCVRFGCVGLGGGFDLVISGINRGYNLGHDIAYSGTCGAIFEAAKHGVKGLALSGDHPTFMDTVAHLDAVWGYINEKHLFELGDLWNVNIPPEADGFALTRQGGMYYTDRFGYDGDDTYHQEGEPNPWTDPDLTVDISAVRAGMISVTPLTFARTDFSALETALG